MAARLQKLGVAPDTTQVINNWADSALIAPPPLGRQRVAQRVDCRRPFRGLLRRQSRPRPRFDTVLSAMTLL